MGTNTFREPPVAGDEPDVLLGILDRTRSALAWKCGGVDAAGMRATVGVSSVTLGGSLKHLAFAGHYYFWHELFGRDPGPPWNTVDWGAEPDWPCRIGESNDGLVGEDPPTTDEP